MSKTVKPVSKLFRKLICVSVLSWLVTCGVANADVAEIQQLLIDMDCEPGAVDGIWGNRSTAAYERLMRETKQPVYTCMPNCSEPVVEIISALKSSNAGCGASFDKNISDGNSSPKAISFNKVVSSCDPWSSEVETTDDGQNILYLSEHDVHSISSGDDLVTHETVRYYRGMKPVGDDADYTTSYDMRGISRTKTQLSKVEAFYAEGKISGKGGHYIRLACKDGTKCIQLLWDALDTQESKSKSGNVFVDSKILPVCTLELAREGVSVINEK